MSKTPASQNASIPRQSDIVIDPDGTVHFSFLWDELSDCVTALSGKKVEGHEPKDLTASKNPVNTFTRQGLDFLRDLEFPQKDYRSCRLCPKKCGFNRSRGIHPRCGDSSLRVSNYGLTMGDEAPIRGTRGSGAIMLGGCSLSCPSCHNPEMVSGGEKISLSKLLDLCLTLRNEGAHNIQFLSPTVHFPALKLLLKELKKNAFDLPIIFKSSGYELPDEIASFRGLVDIWLPDFKYGPGSSWADRAGVPDYFHQAAQAIQKMIEVAGPLTIGSDDTAKSGVLVRHVMAPLPAAERQSIDDFLKSLPKGVMVSYCRDFVDFEAKNKVKS